MNIDRNQLKVLFIDTEWSYAVNYGFPSKKPQFNPARNIKHRQYCTNASWKWEHQVSVQNVSVLSDPIQFKKDFRNDKICAIKMHEVMSSADVIVAHNLDEFDLKMLNVIFALHGLGPIPEKKLIDTLKIARKYFRFSGNGLDDLLKFFGYEGKEEKPDWFGMTEGDPKQIKKSIKYCNKDVLGLEIVFKILRPFMRNISKNRNAKALDHYGITECDACQCKLLQNKGLGGVAPKMYPRVRCGGCGHEMRGDIKLWKKAKLDAI